MAQDPGDGQPRFQRGREWEQKRGRSLAQTEGRCWGEEEEAARVEAEALEEAQEQRFRQIDEEQLLRQIDEEQAADRWQQLAEEDADCGWWYPFLDPDVYW
jgi:hypothetical protein